MNRKKTSSAAGSVGLVSVSLVMGLTSSLWPDPIFKILSASDLYKKLKTSTIQNEPLGQIRMVRTDNGINFKRTLAT